MTSLNQPSGNTGKLMTRRVQARDRCALVLSYSASDANRLRASTKAIRLTGNRAPSLSLIARRSLGLYLERMERLSMTQPEAYQAEIAALDNMGTPKVNRKFTREAA